MKIMESWGVLVVLVDVLLLVLFDVLFEVLPL
jgi:hypothetical protein